jgi:hypothetical protein
LDFINAKENVTVQVTYYLLIYNSGTARENSESTIHNCKRRRIVVALQYEVIPRCDHNKYVMTNSFKVMKHEGSNYVVMMIRG